MIRPALLFWLAFALVLLIGTARAETVAQKVFGKWEPVTPETITKPVPLIDYQRELLGSVQRVANTESTGCPITQNGKTIGWSMACSFSLPFGATHGTGRVSSFLHN